MLLSSYSVSDAKVVTPTWWTSRQPMSKPLSTLCAVPKPDIIHTVALKFPSFWLTCPAIWFVQVEAQSATRQPPIKDEYKYIVAALDIVAAGEVEAPILSPPANNKYPERSIDLGLH